MKTSFYLFDAGEQCGPLDIAEFKRLWLSGTISSDAYYWHDGLASWQSLPLIITSIAERLKWSERNWKQGFTDAALFTYPWIEFIRIWPIEFGERDWAERWQRAGGAVHPTGRFLARKGAEVWDRLGSTELFSDGLDHPFPPFAFGSGFGWREVSRNECFALGVIAADEEVRPKPADMNDGVKVSAKGYDADMIDALIAGLKAEVRADILTLPDSAGARHLRKAAGL